MSETHRPICFKRNHSNLRIAFEEQGTFEHLLKKFLIYIKHQKLFSVVIKESVKSVNLDFCVIDPEASIRF